MLFEDYFPTVDDVDSRLSGCAAAAAQVVAFFIPPFFILHSPILHSFNAVGDL